MSLEKKVKLTVKKIGGRGYLYIQDSIYLNKGEIIKKYKSLGSVDWGLRLVKEIASFEANIRTEEVSKRTSYWKSRTKEKKVYTFISLERLEQLRTALYRGKQKLTFVANYLMETAFKTDFTFNSNKIEGSRLPKATVQKKIEAGDKGNNEVANTIRALEFFDGITMPCSLSVITKGQKILLDHEKTKQGLRNEKMVVGNCDVVPHEKIEEEFMKLMKWYKENNFKLYPLEFAAVFHYKFERIHPFKDGNGRVGRILMNEILKKHRYHPFIVWDKHREAYFGAFEKAMDGKMAKYLKFMFEQYKITYSTYIEKLMKAMKAEEQIEEFFKPSKE